MGTSQDGEKKEKSQLTFCSVILSSVIGQSVFYNNCVALFVHS